MMEDCVIQNIFMWILNQSISASWLMIAVIIIRACMKKSLKSLRYVLWAFVAVRLLCPVAMESTWSLVPNIKLGSQVSDENRYFNSVAVGDVENSDGSKDEYLGINQSQPNNLQNIEAENPNKDTGDVNIEVLPDEVVDITDFNTNRLSTQMIFPIVTGIWMVGMAAIFFSSVISVVRLKNKVA